MDYGITTAASLRATTPDAARDLALADLGDMHRLHRRSRNGRRHPLADVAALSKVRLVMKEGAAIRLSPRDYTIP